MKETLFMYLYAEIEKKSTGVKIYNAIELNFHLGLLRILKEFPINTFSAINALFGKPGALLVKKVFD